VSVFRRGVRKLPNLFLCGSLDNVGCQEIDSAELIFVRFVDFIPHFPCTPGEFFEVGQFAESGERHDSANRERISGSVFYWTHRQGQIM
jgi:hypothetical protein